MRVRRLCVILLLLVTPALSQTQLRMVVVLTRHGVRSPLSATTSNPNGTEPWPSLSQWQVACPGDLTPRGTKLVQQMGIFYHAYYADKGLLPPVGQCPGNKVYIWSDNVERTLGTANAIVAGMSLGISGCMMAVDHLPYTRAPHKGPNQCKTNNLTDYFFHPLSDSALTKNVDLNQVKDAAKKINLEVPQLRTSYQPALQAMQNTLCGGPATTACSSVLNLPTEAKGDDGKLKWTGMFSVSSTDTENFLLEYGNGMPCNLDGWGRVTYNSPDCDGGQPFVLMESLHTLYFDKTNHNGYMAQIQGSNLANQIMLSLEQAGSGPASAPFVIYSGHDTDVSSVAGLLHLKWTLPDLPENDTPPAGALIFELWGGTTPETQAVRMYYVHQMLTQLRTLAPLSLQNPPNMVELQLPQCAEPCPFTQFQTILNGAILTKLTTSGPRGVMVKRKVAKRKEAETK